MNGMVVCLSIILETKAPSRKICFSLQTLPPVNKARKKQLQFLVRSAEKVRYLVCLTVNMIYVEASMMN